MIKFLNDNQGALTVIFSGVVAIATVVYAILTRALVVETKRMREVQTEPKLSIHLEPRQDWINLIDLVIQNIGGGPAYNLKFEITPDFEYSKDEFLSGLGYMRGFKYLAPDQRLQFFLTSMIEDFKKKVETPLTIKVTYENGVGVKFADTFTLDFSEFVGIMQLGNPPLQKIAQSLEKVESHIDKLTRGWEKLKVVHYTPEDLQKENEERLARYQGRSKETPGPQGPG